VATFNLKPVGYGYGLAESPGWGRQLSFLVGAVLEKLRNLQLRHL
jgi:hypothetical protein